MNRFRFTKVREVKSPRRGNTGDAGIDFYLPTNLTPKQFGEANRNILNDDGTPYLIHRVVIDSLPNGFISRIFIKPQARVIIPSGIKVLLEPSNSALIAANKSGISTKKGLIFTAEVVDSPYIGEVHICVVNTSDSTQTIEFGDKALVQFIHTPIFSTTPEEIGNCDYEQEASNWGARGENWQGSTDNK